MKPQRAPARKPGRVRDAASAASAPDDRPQDPSASACTGESRHALIAVEAHRLAEARGFVPGYELDDWLAAEAMIDAKLRVE